MYREYPIDVISLAVHPLQKLIEHNTRTAFFHGGGVDENPHPITAFAFATQSR